MRYLLVQMIGAGFILGLWGLPAAGMGRRGPAPVPVHRAVVVVAAAMPAAAQAAVSDLQLHLSRLTGAAVPVKVWQDPLPMAGEGQGVIFLYGLPGGDPEGAGGYRVFAHRVEFYLPPRLFRCSGGCCCSAGGGGCDSSQALAWSLPVSTFLQDACGFRWPAPGDDWIVRLGRTPPAVIPGEHEESAPPPAVAVQVCRRFPAGTPRWIRAQVAALEPSFAQAERRRQAFEQWLRRLGIEVLPCRDAAEGSAALPRADRGPTGLPLVRWPERFEPRGKQRGARITLASLPSVFEVPGVYARLEALRRPAEDPEMFFYEYSLAYGPAASLIRRYFRFWRDWSAKRLAGNGGAAAGPPAAGAWRRRLAEALEPADFKRTAALLHQAQSLPLPPRSKRCLDQLLIAHTHARMTFEALRARARVTDRPASLERSIEASRRLYRFRKAFKDEIQEPLALITAAELAADDAAGIAWQRLFRDAVPVFRLHGPWHFRADPAGRGAASGWAGLGWRELRRWPEVPADRPWEEWDARAARAAASAAKVSSLTLENYDGFGWYAAAFDLPENWHRFPLWLDIEASDDTVRVYVNGKALGKGPERPPFRVRIDGALSKTALHQIVVLCIHDTGGAGGLRRPPWLSAPPRKTR